MTTITVTLLEVQYKFLIISLSIILRMRNVSDRICRENQNTHFVSSNFFFGKSFRLWENVEKFCRTGQSTDDNIIRRTRIACYITKATNTHLQLLYLLLSHINNCFTNAPTCFVIRTSAVLFRSVLYSYLDTRFISIFNRKLLTLSFTELNTRVLSFLMNVGCVSLLAWVRMGDPRITGERTMSCRDSDVQWLYTNTQKPLLL